MTFGDRLRKARKDKGLTQKQLADLIGAKHNSISDWENNKNRPDPDTIEYICDALEIPVSRLFSESVQNKPTMLGYTKGTGYTVGQLVYITRADIAIRKP